MDTVSSSFLPDALVIGIPQIDEQHAGLFRRLVALKIACIEANDLSSDEADGLLDALREHCATEERLASEAGLDFASHTATHRKMLGEIARTLAHVRAGKTDAFSIIKYLGYWFERHIREEDKVFGRNLQRASCVVVEPLPEAPIYAQG